MSENKYEILDDALFNYKLEPVEVKQNKKLFQPSFFFSVVVVVVVIVLGIICFDKFFKIIKYKFFNYKMLK